MSVRVETSTDSLAGFIQQTSDISVQRCYQCGKCSAGCPASSEMDFAPSVLLRMLQLQNPASDQKVLRSYSIWLCLTCHTCSARCPMEVDLPKVMDVLRGESLRRKLVHPRARDIVAFHQSFIDTIRNFGRLWEVGLIADYKIRTLHFWQDVILAPVMLKKGKLPIVPSLNRKFVAQIFSGLRNRKGQAE
jgi:heterodisulfide reductase subunit C2